MQTQIYYDFHGMEGVVIITSLYFESGQKTEPHFFQADYSRWKVNQSEPILQMSNKKK